MMEWFIQVHEVVGRTRPLQTADCASSEYQLERLDFEWPKAQSDGDRAVGSYPAP